MEKEQQNSLITPVKPQQPKLEVPKEHGGRGGLDPSRFGDWEINGRCVDF